jgi:hypothetical protein
MGVRWEGRGTPCKTQRRQRPVPHQPSDASRLDRSMHSDVQRRQHSLGGRHVSRYERWLYLASGGLIPLDFSDPQARAPSLSKEADNLFDGQGARRRGRHSVPTRCRKRTGMTEVAAPPAPPSIEAAPAVAWPRRSRGDAGIRCWPSRSSSPPASSGSLECRRIHCGTEPGRCHRPLM